MLVDLEQLSTLYHQISTQAIQQKSSILILVATDVDALASCRMLTTLLQSDRIMYTIKQIAGYMDMQQVNSTCIAENTDLTTIIMLNCGGTIDLKQHLSLTASMQCIVFDSHRPIHLGNIHNSEQVLIVNDGSVDESEIPSDLSESEEEEESEESSDIDRIEEMDEERISRKRAARALREEKRQRHDKKRRLLSNYNEFNYYSRPTSMQIHMLLCQVDRISNDSVWLCLVGVTDHYLQSHISHTSYAACYNEILEKVNNLNLLTEGQELKAGTIQQSCEPRFLLYRFWSLYESMINSDYVVSALKLTKSSNLERVNEFLTKAGISLQESKQPYSYLSMKVRTELSTRLMSLVDGFHMEDLFYDSFTRRYDIRTEFSAADVVNAVSALLEHCSSPNESLVNDHWEENWNRAYDALLSDQNIDVLKEGVMYCQQQQQALLRVGASIIEKKQIRIAEKFRYTFLTDLVERDVVLFSQPLMLQKLAQYIVRTKRQSGEWIGRRALPYILCVLNPSTSVYVVTGVSCHEEGEAEVNQFRMLFQLTTEKMEARCRLDSFSGSVMQIHKDELLAFIDELHTSLKEYYVGTALL